MKDLIKNILLEMDFSFVDEIDDSVIPGSELKPNDKRFDFVRSKLIDDKGVIKVKPFNKQDSSMITNFSQSDCLIAREPYDRSKNDGDNVKILKYPNNI